MGSGHSPVPMGCTCGYAKRVKLVKRKQSDPTRPKYSNAVESIAAFADSIAVPGNKARIIRVLVTHLDDACQEAREHNLSRLPGLIRLK